MIKIEADIGQASANDLEGILELQAANQSGRGGALSKPIAQNQRWPRP